ITAVIAALLWPCEAAGKQFKVEIKGTVTLDGKPCPRIPVLVTWLVKLKGPNGKVTSLSSGKLVVTDRSGKYWENLTLDTDIFISGTAIAEVVLLGDENKKDFDPKNPTCVLDLALETPKPAKVPKKTVNAGATAPAHPAIPHKTTHPTVSGKP